MEKSKSLALRCWIGKEVEHNANYGKLTLFVEGSTVDFGVVSELVIKYPEIQFIYLGAGEVDVTGFINIDRASEIRIPFLMECSSNNLDDVPDDIIALCESIIIRSSFAKNIVKDSSKKVFMKYRTIDSVYMSQLDCSSSNSLESLDNMMYSDDVEVYRKGEN